MEKKWYIRTNRRYDSINPDSFNKNIELDPLIVELIQKRGLTDKKKIEKFLYGDINDLYNPFCLKDMKKAVKRILQAIKNKEKIIIFGDYDVDGITATSLFYNFFNKVFNYKADYYLPDRKKEGYGLNKNAINSFIERDYDLLITVDCGITAYKEVEVANQQGLDVIITDHHQTGNILPEALAVIDPCRRDDTYPYQELAGVGVAFKVCQALEIGQRCLDGNLPLDGECDTKQLSKDLERLMDIVALGSIADIVPVMDENRLIVARGLELIKKSKNTGLRVLLEKLGLVGREITTGHVGYIIAPHLNAAGRIDDAKQGLKLLITESKAEAGKIANKLVETNRKRQSIEKKILEEAKKMVEDEIDLNQEKGIVLASKEWHHGVIGIVASRLVEKYYRPTILIAIEDGTGKGSCRSIKGLNIHQALNSCKQILENYGGHEMAAGLTINEKDILVFKNLFNKYLDYKISNKYLIPALEIDAILEPEEVNMGLYNKLEMLKPHGIGNPRPRFMINNIQLNKVYSVGKEKKHLKFSLSSGQDGIAFGFGKYTDRFSDNSLDLAFHLNLNEWQGNRKVQLCLEDYKIREDLSSLPVNYIHNPYLFADKRGCSDKTGYLKKLYKDSNKIAVYFNDFKTLRFIQDELNQANKINVYNASRAEELAEYEKIKQGILLFTPSNLSGYKNKLLVNQIVLLSLPFSIKEIKGVINKYFKADYRETDEVKVKNVDNEKRESELIIHLIYGEREVKTNRKLIKSSLPTSKYLRRLYIYLQSLTKREFVIEELSDAISNEGVMYSNISIIKRSIDILQDIGLVEKKDSTVRLLSITNKKLDLSDSISYNKTISIINQFNEFLELAMARNLFPLIRKINS